MENATKALLIAAAVLIVIVLIALAVSLLKNTNGISIQAGEVSGKISDKTSTLADKLTDSLKNDKISFTIKFNEKNIFGFGKDNDELYKYNCAKGTTWQEFIGDEGYIIADNLYLEIVKSNYVSIIIRYESENIKGVVTNSVLYSEKTGYQNASKEILEGEYIFMDLPISDDLPSIDGPEISGTEPSDIIIESVEKYK